MAFKAQPLCTTHLSTAVPAQPLVDPVNGYGGMLKAPAEQLISPFFHLFKFLLAYSDLLFAVLKSYGKKKSQELLLKKSLSKYLEQMYTGCHEQYQRKHLLQQKEHTNIV